MRRVVLRLEKRQLLGIFTRNLSKNTSRTKETSETPSEESQEDYFQDLNARINKYKHELSKNKSLASFRARELTSQIANISQSIASVKSKQSLLSSLMDPNSLSNIPSSVSIEILSNGTAQMAPSIFLRTPLKTYLFNCPEGAARFIPSLRLKGNNIQDIFVTRGVWDNIGGISGILLGKDPSTPITRLHGAMSVKNFLECIRPFQDADFGSAKYPSQVEECPFSQGVYEDPAMKVTYIPLSAPLSASVGNRKGSSLDMAYLIQLTKPTRRIDVNKILKLKVPKGPLIGQLKAGNSITLSDGSVITPDDVYMDEDPNGTEMPVLLVAECFDQHCLDSLASSSVLQPFLNGTQTLNYMVHLSKSDILRLPKYENFLSGLGSDCQHIIVNGDGPCIPHSEGIYRQQRRLHQLSGILYPDLFPKWTGIVTQNSKLARIDKSFVYAAPLQRFYMRTGGGEEPITLDLREELLEDERSKDCQNTTEEKDIFKKKCFELVEMSEKVLTEEPVEFPCVSFLGTSSATPSKYRNVTGYLVETSPSSSFLVDVGEATLGQLRVLYGDQRCLEILVGLNAVFITHAHQDHIGGIFSIIEKRREAFTKLGIPFKKMALICNRNVTKPLKTYTQSFSSIEDLYVEVNLSTVVSTSHERNIPLSPVQEITPLLPHDLYNASLWGIEHVRAVQVHHTRMANGFVFLCKGKKLVFSGDTKPCDLLVKEGDEADLLIHECTFEDGFEKDAERKKHSTMGQAVDIAMRMKAKSTILTHFSARYTKVPPLPDYLDEKGNIGVAMDNLRARCDHWQLIPRLIPLFRHMFKEELFELGLRKDQRDLRQQVIDFKNSESVVNVQKTVVGKRAAPSNLSKNSKKNRTPNS
ncbi:unnamed protein product, partial [Mesorhabditis belari]|uniref:ribonuclease Z n=1 Tax=Mesorhabditis belari TaxID=2138241 RepID=A0AAF3FEL5_9BILA